MQGAPHTHGVVASGPGSAVLDIGGDRGAAVIFTGRELAGAEIEIREAGAPWDGTHVGVCERQVAGGPRWAALLGPLGEGKYETRLKDHGPAVLAFRVAGGRITTVNWPATEPLAANKQGANHVPAGASMARPAGLAR